MTTKVRGSSMSTKHREYILVTEIDTHLGLRKWLEKGKKKNQTIQYLRWVCGDLELTNLR